MYIPSHLLRGQLYSIEIEQSNLLYAPKDENFGLHLNVSLTVEWKQISYVVLPLSTTILVEGYFIYRQISWSSKYLLCQNMPTGYSY